MLTLTTQRTFRTITSVFLALLLATSCVGLAPVQAFAVTSAEKQSEADEIMRSIDALQTQLNEANAEYDRATQEYETAKAAAEDAAARVQAAKERIAELQERLGERAASMYKTGGSMSFIDVLLGASSFEELVTSWDAFEKISSQDAELVQESKDVKAEAEAAEKEYTEQKAKAAEEVENAKAAQQEIETTKASMEEELTRVNEEVIQLQAKEEEERIAAEEAQRRAEEAQRLAASTVVPGTSGGGGGSTSAGTSGGDGSVNVSGWVNPCPSYYGVTNEFAWAGAWDGNYHNGIDLGAASGAPILSAGPGTVTYVGWYGTGGNAVIVSHGNGVRTIYMHMSAQAATVGQQVAAGDLIGYVGSTGYSTGPHLHFQIEINGTPVNPRNYFSF